MRWLFDAVARGGCCVHYSAVAPPPPSRLRKAQESLANSVRLRRLYLAYEPWDGGEPSFHSPVSS